MKKLLAILLSALLLCAMIPFATVSAAEITEPTVVVSTLEANAGDEIQVEVKLLNNPGVIAATVEIVYDKDVMELVTYYDEDEEVDMNMIEVASGWSSKYITFGPLGRCIVSYINGTASKNVTKEDFFTATFKIKEDAVSGTYPLTIVFDPQNFFAMGFADVNFGSIDGSVTVNGSDPLPPACEHEYDHACDVDCNLCYEPREVEHSVQHVDAVAATCGANGNIEYWYCDVCGMAWLNAECTLNTNLRAVVLPATGEHSYDDEYDADCNVCGDVREVPQKPSSIPGDADGNGRVNNRDLGYIQQYLNDWSDVQLNLDACDVDDNGRVNNRDLGMIQQYLNDWDVTLG